MPPLKLSGPHHVGIVVSNLDASLAWYQELLGFDITHRLEVPEEGLKIAYAAWNGFAIEFFEQVGSAQTEWIETPLGRSFARQGHHHFAFEVADVDATHEELKARGANIAVEPTSAAPLGVRYMFIRDPDGVWLEFLTPLEG
jgi:catechol 2,3-dioxygenase-like lactoylglutathione lyase family enzyme